MKKKVLLVDDEQFFLESLKEGLLELKDVFDTDIAFSVDQAIDQIQQETYDLIISDVRMPGKSGIDLLMYLKGCHFKGGLMIMTAYGTEALAAQIRDLGGIRVLSKPFDFAWFQDLLLEYFHERKGVTGIIEAIDLTSLLQVIHLEKKSTTVEMLIDRSRGYLHFLDGELTNAEFQGQWGEEAAVKLILLNRGHFSVRATPRKIKRTIFTPLLTFLLNITRDMNEKGGGQSFIRISHQSHVRTKTKESFLTSADDWLAFKGFLGIALLTQRGELIASIAPKMDIDAETLAALSTQVLTKTEEIISKSKYGGIERIEIDTPDATICLYQTRAPLIQFHLILLVAPGSDLTVARMILKKTDDALRKVVASAQSH
jgi:CheY-like chemotaxis protein